MVLHRAPETGGSIADHVVPDPGSRVNRVPAARK
jgi:hypothetical protein